MLTALLKGKTTNFTIIDNSFKIVMHTVSLLSVWLEVEEAGGYT